MNSLLSVLLCFLSGASIKAFNQRSHVFLATRTSPKFRSQNSPDDSNIGLIVSKALDTIEDAALHLQRLYSKMSQDKIAIRSADSLDEWNDMTSTKTRLLVLGSGWSSHAFIKVINTSLYRVLVVSPSNYFVFTPMLASTSVGTIEFKSIVEGIRDSNPSVSYIEGSVIDLDLGQKQAEIKLGSENSMKSKTDVLGDESAKDIIKIPFDVAIYGAGVGPLSSDATARTPGLSGDNVFFLKSVLHAKKLRTAVIDLLEEACRPYMNDEQRKRLLTFVIVGGGPTGVEYCGELVDFLGDVTGTNSVYRRRVSAPFATLSNFTRVILLQGASELLLQFDEALRLKARISLESKGVEVRTNSKVSRIDGPNELSVTIDGQEINIRCGLIVWAAGTAALPLTEKIIRDLDTRQIESFADISNQSKEAVNITMPSVLGKGGRLPVDSWLRVIGAPLGSFLAMGDASIIISQKETLPQTAQVAAQQGAYAARLFNRMYDLTGGIEDSNSITSPPVNHDAANGDVFSWLRLRGAVHAVPFTFFNLGQLAFLGGGEALSQLQIGEQRILTEAGSIGFLLWRSVYIVKQVSTRTRILVLFDWFKSKIFGRDVTRM